MNFTKIPAAKVINDNSPPYCLNAFLGFMATVVSLTSSVVTFVFVSFLLLSPTGLAHSRDLAAHRDPRRYGSAGRENVLQHLSGQ